MAAAKRDTQEMNDILVQTMSQYEKVRAFWSASSGSRTLVIVNPAAHRGFEQESVGRNNRTDCCSSQATSEPCKLLTVHTPGVVLVMVWSQVVIEELQIKLRKAEEALANAVGCSLYECRRLLSLLFTLW